jgi:hypothetical protein
MLCWKLLTSINLKRNENSPTKACAIFHVHPSIIVVVETCEQTGTHKQSSPPPPHTHTHTCVLHFHALRTNCPKLISRPLGEVYTTLRAHKEVLRTVLMSTIKALCSKLTVVFPSVSHKPTCISSKHWSLAIFVITKWLDNLRRIQKLEGNAVCFKGHKEERRTGLLPVTSER